MANEKKKSPMEQDEILRLSVRKQDPSSNKYTYELEYVTNDNEGAVLGQILETVLDNKINFVGIPDLIEKAIEAGIDVSFMFPEIKS